MDSIGKGILLTNRDEWSLGSKVKGDQEQDPNLLELKANVHEKKVIVSEKNGDGYLKYRSSTYNWFNK